MRTEDIPGTVEILGINAAKHEHIIPLIFKPVSKCWLTAQTINELPHNRDLRFSWCL